MNLLDPIGLIGLSLLCSALLARVWRSRRGQPTRPSSTLGADLLTVVLLALAGITIVSAVHHAMDPRWLPVGQDWREFVLLALDIQSGGAHLPVPQRYPFYAWLAVQLAELQGLAVHQGLMQLSLLCAGLMPAALYTWGIQLTRRPVAVTGALLSLFIPTIIAILGPPSDYLMHALIHTAVLSAGTAALLRGGPWRFTAWGLSLAALMAVTMKSLPVLLMAAPLGLAGLLLAARASRKRAAWSTIGLILPGLLIWQLYSGIQRWVQEAYTLDYNVYRTQMVVALSHGRNTVFPADLGWHLSDEKRMGYWGVGRPGAWQNLPKTLEFLTRNPADNLPRALRYQSTAQGLAKAVRLPSPAWLGLGLFGILAVGSRGQKVRRAGRLLGLAWVGGMMGAHLLGLSSTLYIARYALVLLVPLPLLLLSGGAWLLERLLPAALRPHDRPWWLLLIGTGLVVGLSSQAPGIQQMMDKDTPEASELSMDVHESFWDWRDGLLPTDQVVDLTENLILADLVSTHTRQVITVKSETTDIRLPPHRGGRRYLVLPGCLRMGTSERVWRPHEADPDRLQTVWTLLVEDLTPDKALRVSRKP